MVKRLPPVGTMVEVRGTNPEWPYPAVVTRFYPETGTIDVEVFGTWRAERTYAKELAYDGTGKSPRSWRWLSRAR